MTQDTGKLARILTLIGGFSSIGIFLVVLAILAFTGIKRNPSENLLYIGIAIFGGIFLLILSIPIFIAANLMKSEEKQKTGGIIAIIMGAVGPGGILTLIGGILAVIDASKREKVE